MYAAMFRYGENEMADIVIEWTPKLLKQLKKVYSEFKDSPEAVFMFMGHEFVSSYTKYMIEYLEGQFKKESVS